MLDDDLFTKDVDNVILVDQNQPHIASLSSISAPPVLVEDPRILNTNSMGFPFVFTVKPSFVDIQHPSIPTGQNLWCDKTLYQYCFDYLNNNSYIVSLIHFNELYPNSVYIGFDMINYKYDQYFRMLRSSPKIECYVFKISYLRDIKNGLTRRLEIDIERNFMNDRVSIFHALQLLSMIQSGIDDGILYDSLSGDRVSYYYDNDGYYVEIGFDCHHTWTQKGKSVIKQRLGKQPYAHLTNSSLFSKDYKNLCDLMTVIIVKDRSHQTCHNLGDKYINFTLSMLNQLLAPRRISIYMLDCPIQFQKVQDWIVEKIATSGGSVSDYSNAYYAWFGGSPTIQTHLTAM